jgi:hypothetical protein
MRNLAQTQAAFAEAVFDTAVHYPSQVRGSARRFAVYRNNVAVGLVSALATRYPVVKRLVGDVFFREMARSYIAVEPPRSPIMLCYGETFPDFVEAFEPARPIPYLGAVARIETARVRAYHAADAAPLGAEAFARVAPHALAGLRVKLHPSVSVVASLFPIYSIWKVNQARAPVIPVSPWAPEAILISRPSYAVQVHKLAQGQDAFLRTLDEGGSISDATEAGQTTAADFDIARSLALLIKAGIVVGFQASGVIRLPSLTH